MPRSNSAMTRARRRREEEEEVKKAKRPVIVAFGKGDKGGVSVGIDGEFLTLARCRPRAIGAPVEKRETVFMKWHFESPSSVLVVIAQLSRLAMENMRRGREIDKRRSELSLAGKPAAKRGKK